MLRHARAVGTVSRLAVEQEAVAGSTVGVDDDRDSAAAESPWQQ